MDTIEYKKYRARYLNARDLKHGAPVDISLELSSFCNMRCSYCYHADKKHLPFKQNYMSRDTIVLILKQASYLGVSSVKLNWRGESTMAPNFYFACHLAHALARGDQEGKVFIDRITNSNFKFPNSNEDIFRALSFQTKVKISYDSFKKDVFEKQRRGGDHDLTTANIDTFYNLPGRTTEIVIQAVRTQANKDEDLEHELKKRWPYATLSIRDVVDGRLDKDINTLLVRQRDIKNRVSCIQAHARLIFDWSGTASPCCPDIKNELALGNIHTMSLADIWHSEKAVSLRRSLLDKSAFNMSPCLTCSSHESYAGYKPPAES